jgi:plasmid maintenance system antidote protein VapI
LIAVDPFACFRDDTGALAFETTPESWSSRLMEYDLWKAEQNRDTLDVKRIKAA